MMICISLFLVELACILIGALVAPKPAMVLDQTSIACVNHSYAPDHWFLPKKCVQANLDPHANSGVRPDDVVFAVKVPKQNFNMSRWFQFMLSLLILRTQHHSDNAIKNDSYITMNIRVGYSNDPNANLAPEAWTELFSATESRKLECLLNKPVGDSGDGYEYDCDPIHFFQLGSIPHKFYLINVKLPTPKVGGGTNSNLGQVQNLDFVTITQTGGFTKVWVSLKCAFFVLLLFPIVWYWNRIQMLQRKSSLLERIIFGLGLSMEFLNLPLELITIYCDAPWMLVFTDIRQGILYVVLLSFWIIFIGEHLMDQANRNQLSTYKLQLSCISIGTLAMLSFELAERGTQVVKPTATIWSNHSAAYLLLVIGATFATVYMLMLVYFILKSVRSIHYKKRFTLPADRLKRFERIVKRFYTLLFFTFATALTTVVFYFFQQKLGSMAAEWFSVEVQTASGFFTGVYGLWNIYVTVVLWLYAPSHKVYQGSQEEHELPSLNAGGSLTEQIHLMSISQAKEVQD